MKGFYFNKFESRKPYLPVKESGAQFIAFQAAGLLTLLFGGAYIVWRWTSSLNFDSIVFSITLAVAETVSLVSIAFFVFDMWQSRDEPMQAAPRLLSDIEPLDGKKDRPLKIDVFIATYNEEMELVRYTIRDAKQLKYPHKEVSVRIFVLDDGRRDGRDASKENFKQLCAEEKVYYLTRENNLGFKAGNLKNGLANSSGDLFAILDADARPFPTFLENTAGYFRKRDVAWVQTCQWFYDTTESLPLGSYLARAFGIRAQWARRALASFLGGMKTGGDIFGSDPRQFYQVIQRRRNFHNASFCCGAGSLHRREAVMSSAVNTFAEALFAELEKARRKMSGTDDARFARRKLDLVKSTQMTPFRFHASEDLYTSMIIHSDEKHRWRSVMHPYVECKMLSPQDIDSFVKQRSRYAEGSIDIFLRDNPLLRKGLTWRQKICYFNSTFSYFTCVWTLIFLFSPIIFFYTGVMPVACQTADFFYYFLPFFLSIKLAEVAGSWGVSQKRGKQYHICLFWLNLLAILKVVSGRKIKFNVTPKSKLNTGQRPWKYAWPHVLIVSLTAVGLVINLPRLATGDSQFLMAMLVNGLWSIHNAYTLMVYVRAAFWDTEKMAMPEQEPEADSGERSRSWVYAWMQPAWLFPRK